MATKLHRCGNTWIKIDAHPCHRVQKALDEKGIDYEVVKHPLRPSRREELRELSGQDRLPVIETDDGVVREESKDLAAKVRAGELP
jgi:glutathione S-transferase